MWRKMRDRHSQNLKNADLSLSRLQIFSNSPVLGFLIELTSYRLCPDWIDAVLGEGALHPRQHDVVVHCFRIHNEECVTFDHLKKQKILRIGVEIFEHFLMS